MKLYRLSFLFLFSSVLVFGYEHDYQPNVTVVFVVDQLSQHLLDKARPFLRYGIKDLIKNGIVYHDATYPHAMPITPTGHAAISTGAFGCVHGISSYGSLDSQNNFVRITDSEKGADLVYSPEGTYDYGKSAKHLTCDTLADQFFMNGKTKRKEHLSASFAIKSRAAIMLSGHCSQAFWFDDKAGGMATSQYYSEEMPKWLKKFNKKKYMPDGKKFNWKPFYNKRSDAYSFFGADNYDYSVMKNSFKNRKFTIDYNLEDSFNHFKVSPFSSHLLMDAAKSFMRKNSDKRLLIYISLSNFDYSGHLFGPDSREQLDLLYYLDFQIGKMISFTNNVFGAKKSLFVLTSDHGAMSIPEILNEKGFKLARRWDANKIIDKINNEIEIEFGYKKIIKYFEEPQIYLDRKVMDRLTRSQKANIYDKIKKILKSEPAIMNCWSRQDFEENSALISQCGCYGDLFCKQFNSKTSGDIIYLVHPYQIVSAYSKGASHTSPYRYDTHVPLVFMQKLRLRHKDVHEPVSMLQLAASQAKLMGVDAPCASCSRILPEIR